MSRLGGSGPEIGSAKFRLEVDDATFNASMNRAEERARVGSERIAKNFDVSGLAARFAAASATAAAFFSIGQKIRDLAITGIGPAIDKMMDRLDDEAPARQIAELNKQLVELSQNVGGGLATDIENIVRRGRTTGQFRQQAAALEKQREIATLASFDAINKAEAKIEAERIAKEKKAQDDLANRRLKADREVDKEYLSGLGERAQIEGKFALEYAETERQLLAETDAQIRQSLSRRLDLIATNARDALRDFDNNQAGRFLADVEKERLAILKKQTEELERQTKEAQKQIQLFEDLQRRQLGSGLAGLGSFGPLVQAIERLNTNMQGRGR